MVRYAFPHLMLLLLVAVAPASAQLDSGFSWVNPAPLGDDLYDVERVTFGTFVAVSNNGFIYRTVDAGVSWQPVHFEMGGPLFSVELGDGVLLAGGQSGRMHRSEDAGRSWTYGKIPDFPYSVRDIHIFDPQRVIVVASNLAYSSKIAYTRDGMQTWTILTPDSTGYSYYGIDFVDDLHGWACGSPGVLLRTSDGGETWQKDTSSLIPGKALSAVEFRNRDTGVVAGDVGRILVTHDGGSTWMQRPQREATVFREAEWINDSTIVLIGDGQQFRSTDAGLTWVEMSAARSLLGLGFSVDDMEGIAVGPLGEIVYTNDGGTNWTRRTRGTTGFRLLDLDFYDDSTAVAVGEGAGLIYTRDGGATWIRRAIVSSGPVGNLLRVTHVTSDTVVALSATGIFISEDGGENWRRADHPGTGDLTDMYFLADGTGWAVGRQTFLRTLDHGVSWQERTMPVSTTLWAVFALDRLNLYVTAEGGSLYFSRNGGLSWTERPTNTPARLTYVRADESGRNITLGWSGGLFVSDAAGVLWEERRAPLGAKLVDFSFLSPTEGWAGQQEGPMLSTTDGGVTWQEHEYGIRHSFGGATTMSVVELVHPGFGYLAGYPGFILEYRDPDMSGVEERDAGLTHHQAGLEIRNTDDHIVVAGARGDSDILVYDVLGRVLHRVRKEEVAGGNIHIDIEAVSQGVLFVVEEESGRSGRGVVVGSYEW